MRSKFCLFPLLTVLAAAQQPSPGRGVNFYSIEKEIALGRQLAAEFQRTETPLDSPAVPIYVNDLGHRLAAQAGNGAFPYTFVVIAGDPTVLHEPVAFPGGFIFVPARLILTAGDEDELAGMLAHSIAHVSLRHGTKEATRAELVQLSAIPLVYVGGRAGAAIADGGAMAIPIAMQTFHRRNELEADSVSVRIMSAAGYDPAALARYIEREQRDEGRGRIWSAFPTRTQRLTAIQTAIATLPPIVYERHPDFDAIQAEVRGLLAK